MSTTPQNTTVHLDLDSLEREQVDGVPKAKAKPYFIKAGGEVYTFRDAVELNYTVLATMEQTPTQFFRAAILDEDGSSIRKFLTWANDTGEDGTSGLSGLKLRAIMQGYRDYYGLDKMGNAAGS